MVTSTTRRKRKAEVKIRGCEPGDLGAVAEIRSGPSVLAGTLAIPHTSVEELRRRLGQTDPDTRTLVAQVGDKVLGYGALHLKGSPRLRHSAEIFMVVHEEHHGRGVGGALLDALIELAERWCGVLRLHLSVFVDNTAAIALYHSRGFIVEGVARAFALRDGQLVDCFVMARVSPRLPWPQITAEDAAVRTPPQLTAGHDESGNGHGRRKPGRSR